MLPAPSPPSSLNSPSFYPMSPDYIIHHVQHLTGASSLTPVTHPSRLDSYSFQLTLSLSNTSLVLILGDFNAHVDNSIPRCLSALTSPRHFPTSVTNLSGHSVDPVATNQCNPSIISSWGTPPSEQDLLSLQLTFPGDSAPAPPLPSLPADPSPLPQETFHGQIL